MTDPRLKKLAQVLVHYSLAIKPGDRLRLRGDVGAAPLFTEVYREAVRAGAHVIQRFVIDDLKEIFFKEATDEQLQYVPDLVEQELRWMNVDLYLDGEVNTKHLAGVDPKRIAMNSAARQPLGKLFDELVNKGELRWSLSRYPNQAYAQDAGMSLSDYEDFMYEACLLNEPDPIAAWQEMDKMQRHIADYLIKHNEIHIVAPGTDIKYCVGGRKWISCDGKMNFPDGEVFSAPIEDSVNGTVSFTYPAVYYGNEVEGVQLTFENGKVVEAKAERNLPFLEAMLNMDAGSRILGEVAFGTNYRIKRFSRDILFDEKIGGTMHMALGSTYEEAGGKNESGLHWDMVCDLREGKVFADGELCYENGKFII